MMRLLWKDCVIGDFSFTSLRSPDTPHDLITWGVVVSTWTPPPTAARRLLSAGNVAAVGAAAATRGRQRAVQQCGHASDAAAAEAVGCGCGRAGRHPSQRVVSGERATHLR